MDGVSKFELPTADCEWWLAWRFAAVFGREVGREGCSAQNLTKRDWTPTGLVLALVRQGQLVDMCFGSQQVTRKRRDVVEHNCMALCGCLAKWGVQ
ncbi:hypothetical protein NL676_023566 [Syzygium grande]|nr:hypothetical protein NL676_023566 [Syzygium grande]